MVGTQKSKAPHAAISVFIRWAATSNCAAAPSMRRQAASRVLSLSILVRRHGLSSEEIHLILGH
jgi:hypothetical protein